MLSFNYDYGALLIQMGVCTALLDFMQVTHSHFLCLVEKAMLNPVANYSMQNQMAVEK